MRGRHRPAGHGTPARTAPPYQRGARCACGTGVDAAVLARRGFNTWAADGSAEMVAQARARFEREGLAVPVLCSEWAELATATGQRFDAVLCIGYSLCTPRVPGPWLTREAAFAVCSTLMAPSWSTPGIGRISIPTTGSSRLRTRP